MLSSSRPGNRSTRAVMHVLKAGRRWRDCPKEYGPRCANGGKGEQPDTTSSLKTSFWPSASSPPRPTGFELIASGPSRTLACGRQTSKQPPPLGVVPAPFGMLLARSAVTIAKVLAKRASLPQAKPPPDPSARHQNSAMAPRKSRLGVAENPNLHDTRVRILGLYFLMMSLPTQILKLAYVHYSLSRNFIMDDRAF